MEALMSSKGYSLTENISMLSDLMDDVYKTKGLVIAPSDDRERSVRSNSAEVETLTNIREY